MAQKSGKTNTDITAKITAHIVDCIIIGGWC